MWTISTSLLRGTSFACPLKKKHIVSTNQAVFTGLIRPGRENGPPCPVASLDHMLLFSRRLAGCWISCEFFHKRLPPSVSSLNFAAVKKTSRPIIPRKTIYRLSIYTRCLARLRENGIGTVSSEALAKAAGVKPTQLRKDLAYFGTFGTRGLGYDVLELSQKISDELGTSSLQPVILVGVGHLGLALISYRGFEKEGFEIVAAFDTDPGRKRDKKISQPIYGIEAMPKFIAEHNVKMAILSVPVAVAQEVTNTLINCGVMGILNFAPIVLAVPEDVMVNNVNLAIELENLSYFIQS